MSVRRRGLVRKALAVGVVGGVGIASYAFGGGFETPSEKIQEAAPEVADSCVDTAVKDVVGTANSELNKGELGQAELDIVNGLEDATRLKAIACFNEFVAGVVDGEIKGIEIPQLQPDLSVRAEG